MKKNFLILSAMLTCLISMFTSCVQSDLYELYDDETEILSPRKKGAKDMEFFEEPKYTCGIHCLKYISHKSLYVVGRAAQDLGINPFGASPLRGIEILSISNAISAGLSGCVDYVVNGQDNRANLVNTLNSYAGSKISILVNIEHHWIVGEEVYVKENKKTGEKKYKLRTVDPQNNSGNVYETNDESILAIIY